MNELNETATPAPDNEGRNSSPLRDTPAEVGRTGVSAWSNPWLYLALAALALAGWQWGETRMRLSETQQELARRLSASETGVQEGRLLAKQAQEQTALLQAKLAELELRLAESRSQHETLENLYQNLARNSEESALAEIEQSLTLASQQLQLAGNVQGAVLVLQNAEARLAASKRPQFIALRHVIARDLDRLRALPQLDLPGLYARLEGVIGAVDSLPLAVTGRPREESQEGPAEALPLSSPTYWRLLLGDLWKELRSLVRIQRFDRDEPALLAPGQAFFLRENLKLRLLNARLALLTRDQWTYRKELRQAQEWVGRYFDQREKTVQTSLHALGQLLATEISIELPHLNESLSAIKTARIGKERR